MQVSISDQKNSLRLKMKDLLKKSPAPTVEVFDFPQSVLLAFIPMKSEVNIRPLMERALTLGKTVAVPSEDPRYFAVVGSNSLIDLCEVSDALVLVPGLAFTEAGARLGRGGGFYDRALALLPVSNETVGICRKCQLVESVPLEKHDKPVNKVLAF